MVSCLVSVAFSSYRITEGFAALLEPDGSIAAWGSYTPTYYVRQSLTISKHFLFSLVEWSTSFAMFDTLQTDYGYKMLTLLGELQSIENMHFLHLYGWLGSL